jgi:hypothetical protein
MSAEHQHNTYNTSPSVRAERQELEPERIEPAHETQLFPELLAGNVSAYCYEAVASHGQRGYAPRSTRNMDALRRLDPGSTTFLAYGMTWELTEIAERSVPLTQVTVPDPAEQPVRLSDAIGNNEGATIIMDDPENRLRNLLFLYRDLDTPDGRRPLSALAITVAYGAEFSLDPEYILHEIMPPLMPELSAIGPANPGADITIGNRIYTADPKAVIKSVNRNADPATYARKHVAWRRAKDAEANHVTPDQQLNTTV